MLIRSQFVSTLHCGVCGSQSTNTSILIPPSSEWYEWPGRRESLEMVDEQRLSSWHWCTWIGSASSSKIVSGLLRLRLRDRHTMGSLVSDWVIDVRSNDGLISLLCLRTDRCPYALQCHLLSRQNLENLRKTACNLNTNVISRRSFR